MDGRTGDRRCTHDRGTYSLRGGLWAWACHCGAEGRATVEDNRPGAAYAGFLLQIGRPDLIPDSERAFTGRI